MRKIVRSIMLGSLSATLAVSLPVAAASINIGFTQITPQSLGEDLVAGQLNLEVEMVAGTDYGFLPDGYDWVSFTFSNTGGIASKIAEVYWDWEAPSVIPPLVPNVWDPTAPSPGGFFYYDSSGETWSLDPGLGNVNPGNLPSGGSFNADAAGDSDAHQVPGRTNGNGGIVPGETATFFMGLVSGADWDDVSGAIYGGFIDFGMHVRAIGTSGGSESFVSIVPIEPGGPLDPGNPVVPVPAAAGLGFLGMALVAVARRKRS